MYKVYVIDKPIYSNDEHFFEPSQACSYVINSNLGFCDPLNKTLYAYIFNDVQQIQAKVIKNVPTKIELTINTDKITSNDAFSTGQIRSIRLKKFEMEIGGLKINDYEPSKDEITINKGEKRQPITIIIKPEKNISIPPDQKTNTIRSLSFEFKTDTIKINDVQANMSFVKGYVQIEPSKDIKGVKGSIKCQANTPCDLTVDEITGITKKIKDMTKGNSYDFYYFTKEINLMNIDKVHGFIIFDMYCRFKFNKGDVSDSENLTALQKMAADRINNSNDLYLIFKQFIQKCKQDYLFSKALASNYVYHQNLKLDFYSMYVYLFIKMKQNGDITDIIDKINIYVDEDFRESFEKNYLEKICEPNNIYQVERNIKTQFLSDIRKCQYVLINTKFDKNKVNQDNLNEIEITYDSLFSQSVSVSNIKSIQYYVKGLDDEQKNAFNKNIISVIDNWIDFIMERHNRNINSVFPDFINYHLYMSDIEHLYKLEIETLKAISDNISTDIGKLDNNQMMYTTFLETYDSLDILIYKKIMDKLKIGFEPYADNADKSKKMLFALLTRIYQPFDLVDPSNIKNGNIKKAYDRLNHLNCIYYILKLKEKLKENIIKHVRVKTYTIFGQKRDIVLD